MVVFLGGFFNLLGGWWLRCGWVGERVGGQQVGGAYGLGYVILRELKINARTDTMMVAVVCMVILALGLYGLVSLIAARAASWSETDLKPLEN